MNAGILQNNTQLNDETRLKSVTIPGGTNDGMCLEFAFTFKGLREVNIFAKTSSGTEDTVWRLTKEDRHAIPEGTWLLGQVGIPKYPGADFWV